MNSSKWPAVAFPLLGVAVFGLLMWNERQPTTPPPTAQGQAQVQPAAKATSQAAPPSAKAPAPAQPANAAKAPAPAAAPVASAGTTALPKPPQPTTANPPGEAAAAPGEVAIFFAANAMGELVDCGCRANPLGGLARRVKWIEERSTRYKAAAHVDAGGSLMADPALDTDGPGQAQGRVNAYLAGLAASKGLALNVAPAELAVGLDLLRGAAKTHKVPLLATNTVQLGTGKPAFERVLIRQIGALKVAFIGLTSTRRVPRRQDLYAKNKLDLRPSVDAAKAVVAEVRSKVDAIVALSWLTLEEIDELGEKVPEIDFVLGARDSDLTMRPEFLGRGYRLDSYNKGKWLGELRLRKGTKGVAGGRWFDPDLRDRLAYDQGAAQRQIAYYAKKHSEEDAAGGPKDARSRKFERERLVGLRAKLARVNLELKGEIDPPQGGASFSVKLHAMRTSLPESPAVTKLVAAHHAKFPPPAHH